MTERHPNFVRIPYRTYTGLRNRKAMRCEVRVIDAHGDSTRLPLCLNIISYSPDGFEWGYGGSGPGQLALAILVDIFGRKVALQLHQRFKREVIARLPRLKSWTMKEQDIIAKVQTMFDDANRPATGGSK